MARTMIGMILVFSKSLSHLSERMVRGFCLLVLMLVSVPALTSTCRAQEAKAVEPPPPKRVLLLFSEARDLPGNTMMEQAVRAEILKGGTNSVEFFAENLDVGRFSDAGQYGVFKEFLEKKYAGKNLDLVMAFIARDFGLVGELTATVVSNLPVVFVAVNELELPAGFAGGKVAGIIQHFDVEGTIKLIFHLQPATRRLVVIGGVSPSDRQTLARIEAVDQALDNIDFEYWTNRPMAEVRRAVAELPEDSVVLLGTVQRDVTGQQFYTAQVGQMLAVSASAPIYVLSAGMIGSGVLGGDVVDFENLGTAAGRLAVQTLAGLSATPEAFEIRKAGTPMFDWRALQRWRIRPGRLPLNAVIRYRPRSLWEEHKTLFLSASLILLAQGITIAALLAQRTRRRRAEAEIQNQRMELAHVTRVSTVGQLASALTHELNQPLAAILRNAEAAEMFLQREQPDLEEVRAILADIRKDDQRAGDVIDRMRTLLKRRRLESTPLDLRALIEDTLVVARNDARARQVKLTSDLPPQLPAVPGDRVHLQQVLLNLILNGMDAMSECPADARSLVVRVRNASAGSVEVSVTDRGSGLAPEAAARIFESFFTTKPQGLGMGLAISRTIIEAHGGKIRGENNPGRGATFTVTLPAAKS